MTAWAKNTRKGKMRLLEELRAPRAPGRSGAQGQTSAPGRPSSEPLAVKQLLHLQDNSPRPSAGKDQSLHPGKEPRVCVGTSSFPASDREEQKPQEAPINDRSIRPRRSPSPVCAVACSEGSGSALPPLFEGVFKTRWGEG